MYNGLPDHQCGKEHVFFHSCLPFTRKAKGNEFIYFTISLECLSFLSTEFDILKDFGTVMSHYSPILFAHLVGFQTFRQKIMGSPPPHSLFMKSLMEMGLVT